MSERSLTLDAGSDSIFVTGGESVLADYDLSSCYLPIAISSDPDKEFAGWYNGEDLMSYQDLPNVEGNQTWEAKFIDIEPSSIHLNFSSGSTDGVNPVTLTNQPLTIGGVPVIVNTASNGFTIDGESFSDPTISTQAAEACNTPIGVVGAVEGYDVMGTFIGVDLLDADHTGQLDTGEFFVGLKSNKTTVHLVIPEKYREYCRGIFVNGLPYETDYEVTNVDYIPIALANANKNMAFTGWLSSHGTYDSEFVNGETYTAQFEEADAFSMVRAILWVRSNGSPLDVQNLVFCGVSLPDDLKTFVAGVKITDDTQQLRFIGDASVTPTSTVGSVENVMCYDTGQPAPTGIKYTAYQNFIDGDVASIWWNAP